MDGFRVVIANYLMKAGVREEDIFYGGQFSKIPANLPSYYRASKNWDVVVCKNSRFKGLEAKPVLVAAIEFKSQNESIGNNQNNRIEESIGNAADFWESYANKNFIHLQPRPWLGYLFVGRYLDENVSKGVEIKQPHFPCDPMFEPTDNLCDSNIGHIGPSYARRYQIFLERMIAKKLYDGAAFITTNEKISDSAENYRCLYPELSGRTFLDQLLRHIQAYYPDNSIL